MKWFKNNFMNITWAIFLIAAGALLYISLGNVQSTTEFSKIQADNAILIKSVVDDMSGKLDSMQTQIDSLNVFVQNPQ